MESSAELKYELNDLEEPAPLDEIVGRAITEKEEEKDDHTNMNLVYHLVSIGTFMGMISAMNTNGVLLLFDNLGWSRFQFGFLTSVGIAGYCVGAPALIHLSSKYAIPPLILCGAFNLFTVCGRFLTWFNIVVGNYYGLFLISWFSSGMNASWILRKTLIDHFTDQSLRITTVNVQMFLGSAANAGLLAGTLYFFDTLEKYSWLCLASAILQFLVSVHFWSLDGPPSMPKSKSKDHQLRLHDHRVSYSYLLSITKFRMVLISSMIISSLGALSWYFILWIRDAYGWSKAEMQFYIMCTAGPASFIALFVGSYYFDGTIGNDELCGRDNSSRSKIFLFLATCSRNVFALQLVTMNLMCHFGPYVFLACLSSVAFAGSFIPSMLLVMNSVPVELTHFAVSSVSSVAMISAAVLTPCFGAMIDHLGSVTTFMIVVNAQWIAVIFFTYQLHLEKSHMHALKLESEKESGGTPTIKEACKEAN